MINNEFVMFQNACLEKGFKIQHGSEDNKSDDYRDGNYQDENNLYKIIIRSESEGKADNDHDYSHGIRRRSILMLILLMILINSI